MSITNDGVYFLICYYSSMNEGKLYHRVPKDMRDNILLPLSGIKDKHPDLYEKILLKYKGREHFLEDSVPSFYCDWKDVINFSPVHPSILKEALEKEKGKLPEWEFFEIDPHILNKKDAIVYKFTNIGDKITKDDFEKYDPNKISQYSEMPQETIDYYKDEIKNGRVPFLFHKIPHVLYKGNIDISDESKVKRIPV